MLLEIDPEKHKDFVIGEVLKKVLRARMLKAFHGMLMESILHHEKLKKEIEAEVCQVNPCDICATNKIVNGKQHTLIWRDDEAK